MVDLLFALKREEREADACHGGVSSCPARPRDPAAALFIPHPVGLIANAAPDEINCFAKI
jgi:hypothetical protein